MYIIAEIGINHNGDLALAKDMISAAKGCGANAVKFQKRQIDTVYTAEFLDSPRDTPAGVLPKLPTGGSTQRQQKNALEFSWDEYDEIDRHCKTLNIDWFGSAWDVESLYFLDQYSPPYHKIASPFVTNLEFVEQVAKLKRKVILSTGMSTNNQVLDAVNILQRHQCAYIPMHCVSIYPCPPKYCNVKKVMYLQGMFPGSLAVGYSGHESGIAPTLTAIANGATYIERHFTLDRSMYGSDQSASLEPKGLCRIVEYAKEISECLRDDQATRTERLRLEFENAKKLRYWEAN